MMKNSISTLLTIGIIVTVNGANSSIPQTLKIDGTRRIIDGYPVNIEEVPYFIYCTAKDNLCGGSLISHRWVVTAAHCLYIDRKQVPNAHIILYAGTSKSFPFETTVQKRHVALSMIHPDWWNPYSPHIVDNDIALLKTHTPFEYNSYVKPVALAPSNYVLSDGVEAIACGFGDTKPYGPLTPSPVLYAVAMRKQKCGRVARGKTILCFEGINTMASGTCQGDSGGPLIYETLRGSILIGVTSGSNCKIDKAFSRSKAFTNVSLYRDWIRSNTGV